MEFAFGDRTFDLNGLEKSLMSMIGIGDENDANAGHNISNI